MALATRCPHCQTAFKVANDQLKLHAGLVRCGSCQQTFNAIENLIPVDGQKPTPAPAPARKAIPATTANQVPLATAPVAASGESSAQVPASLNVINIQTGSKPEEQATPVVAANLLPASLPAAAAVVPTPLVPLVPLTAAPAPAAPPAPIAAVDKLQTANKPNANSKPAMEVLAAISKAEEEFEAETFDMPRDLPLASRSAATSATPAAPAITTVTPAFSPVVVKLPESKPVAIPDVGDIKPVTDRNRLEPVLDPVNQFKSDLNKSGQKNEPSISSSSALDFDLGDGGFLLPSEEMQQADLSRMELETRAALMDPPTADWSVSEGIEEADSEEKLPEFPATEIADAHSVSKVWRHKDHADVAAPDDAVSINDDATDGLHKESYIGEAEAALANQAAINEDSSSDPEVEIAKPNFVIQAEKQRSRKRIANIMLGLMIVLLIPLLLGQSAYIFRNQLAARVPETKPWLQQACKYLSCQVTLPAQIEKIFVDSNELQNLAPERNVFMLVMQIQNQSDVAQTWPNIELVLNDVKDKPLLQRAFTPADYLTEKDKLEKGFAAGGEQNIKLYFELPALKAAGFHVGVFYP